MYAGFIYCWTHKETNMKYIGSHKGTIDDGYIGSGKRFLNAVNKYGIEFFERTILEYVDDEDSILLVEQKYLDIYDVANSNNFYNISPAAGGGDCGNGKKISETKKKRFASGELVNYWNKGVPISEQQKEKLSDTWLVIEPDGNEVEITNMSQYCAINNLNPSAMAGVARGKRQHHKGYRCKKLTNNRNIEYEYTQWKSKGHKTKARYGSENGSAKRITIHGIEYGSMIEASKATGLSMYKLRKQGTFI